MGICHRRRVNAGSIWKRFAATSRRAEGGSRRRAFVRYWIGQRDAAVRFTTLCQFSVPRVVGGGCEGKRPEQRTPACSTPPDSIPRCAHSFSQRSSRRPPLRPLSLERSGVELCTRQLSDTAKLGTYDLEITTDDGTLARLVVAQTGRMTHLSRSSWPEAIVRRSNRSFARAPATCSPADMANSSSCTS